MDNAMDRNATVEGDVNLLKNNLEEHLKSVSAQKETEIEEARLLAAIGAELIEKQSVEMEKLLVDLSVRDKQVEGLQAQLASISQPSSGVVDESNSQHNQSSSSSFSFYEQTEDSRWRHDKSLVGRRDCW